MMLEIIIILYKELFLGGKHAMSSLLLPPSLNEH
jgi:hypothetical protein